MIRHFTDKGRIGISDKLFPTTVVGSYPVTKSVGLRSFLDPLHSAVERAVTDQITAGIDIISDGQVRGDMITVFISQLPGIRGQVVGGKVLPADQPVTLADTRYALTRHPEVKGILTGPSTLAHGLRIGTPLYRNREELVLDLAQALASEARALDKVGVTVLQIDEPIFSTGAADLDVGKKAIEIVTADLKAPISLHVCGELIDVIDGILAIPVSMYDFEFSGSQENLEVVSAKDLKGRLLGYGCVDTADPAVEHAATIEKRIEKGVQVFDPDQMVIDPDCGMRMLSRNSAFCKLKNMVEASRAMRIAYANSSDDSAGSGEFEAFLGD
ncbi:MAG: methionine synthase [Methanomicrobiales archaeon]|nr:methionine synthase [Methanomicrobiales archaeon]